MGSAIPDTQRKCPLISHAQSNVQTGIVFVSYHRILMTLELRLRLASQRRAGRPWRWLVALGQKTTRAKLPRATAPQATPGAHRSSPSPRSAGRRSGKSFGLACMIRLQTAKTSEKTTLDWAGPSACCRGNHIQQAHTVGRHSADSVFKSFHAPFRISASSGNEQRPNGWCFRP